MRRSFLENVPHHREILQERFGLSAGSRDKGGL
jgi:hypothetical protein